VDDHQLLMGTRIGRGYLVATAFLSGLAVMIVEMTAVRAVAPYFGASTYTWTNVIGVILGALAVGYFLGGRFADRVPRPTALYAVILLGAVLCLVLPLVVNPVSRWLLPADPGLEGVVAPVYRASLVATLLLFAPPILLLGAVSPMAVKLLARPDRVGGASGQIFAASTLGSILGTFLTTLYLVPTLGTRMTITVAGVLLAATAVAGFLITAVSRRSTAVSAGAGVIVALLVLGSARAGPLKEAIEEVESAYQYIRVREVRQGDESVLMLQINEAESAYQSVKLPGTVLTNGRYYDYDTVLPLLLPPDRKGTDVLVIGLAAGTIPAQLRHFFPEGLRVTGVEIDPAVIRLGRDHFGMPRDADWLETVVADGRIFLKTTAEEPAYDLIVVDAFAKEYYIPFHLATVEAFTEMKARLRPGGILAMNVASYRPDGPVVAAIEATVARVFGKAHRVWVSGYPNFMVFAMKDVDPPLWRLRRLPERGPPDWDELRWTAEYVGTATVTVLPGENDLVLTDDLAPVERLTDRAVERESRVVLGD
jgi:spermidine synthase